MRTMLALMVVGGVVISGHAQAPSTTQIATTEKPTFTANVVTTNGTSEIRDVVVRFGNGWELRADILTRRRKDEGSGGRASSNHHH